MATVKVPFIHGGAEVHAEGLRAALTAAGHEVDLLMLPFKWYPPERVLDHILSCRLLDLTESEGQPIDLLIGLKFPAYCIRHPRKVLWIIHQHRQAYDLWERQEADLVHAGDGRQVREAVRQADFATISEARAVFSNSANVANRLRKFTGIESEPLYHPPLNAEAFHCSGQEDFFFAPGRLWPNKRQSLIIESLALTKQPVRVCFAGVANHEAYENELKRLARLHAVDSRVEWLGRITEQEKLDRYARCLGVLYPPEDEDYGYVTLEAMLSSKPVITCSDSGGPLEFVIDERTGLVASPDTAGLAAAMDTLWRNRDAAREWGLAGRRRYAEFDISWDTVVRRLLA